MGWTLETLLELAEKMARNINSDNIVSQEPVRNINSGRNITRRKVERPHWKQRVCQSEHRHVYGSREETLGLGMTETQREVFLMVDEFWKARGYAPSVREIAQWRKRGVSNTQKVIDRLVKIGALKRIEGMQRTLRPTYMRFRDIE